MAVLMNLTLKYSFKLCICAGDYRTALHAKAEAAADALVKQEFKLVFLHVKAVDDTGHDRLTHLKVIAGLTPQIVPTT